MPDTFHHDGFDISYTDEGSGEPVLFIHGFASSAKVNWISTGWTSYLQDAGYRTIVFDNRGHGQSTKSYNEHDYSPGKMAADAAALLVHLQIKAAHVIGYSMGARISTFLAILFPKMVRSLTLGGLGIGLVDGVGDWDPIAAALLTEAPETITDPRGAAFRKFADATKSDRRALAACIARSRELVTKEQLSNVEIPTLVAVGTKDDIGGSPHELAALMPHAAAFDIKGCDHMRAVGDPTFERAVLELMRQNPM